MKNLLLFLLVIITVCTVNAQETWEVQRYKDIDPVKDICFVGSHGWAVGQNMVYYSSDYGNKWLSQNPQSNVRFYSVSFTGLQNGWAVGAAGNIINTTDAGKHWQVDNKGANLVFSSVFFIDEMNGWIVGRNDVKHEAVVLKTINGGKNWNETTIGSAKEIPDKVFFINKQTGWITANFPPTIYRTTDAGFTWEYTKIPVQEVLHSIYFINDKEGWACGGYYDRINGSRSLLLKTVDGGVTWQILSDKYLYQLTDIHFINNKAGFCIGYAPAVGCGLVSALVLKTTDGGMHWIRNDISQNLFLSNIFIDDGHNAWIVGENNFGKGGILHAAISMETNIKERDDAMQVILTPNPATDYIEIAINNHGMGNTNPTLKDAVVVYDVLGNVALTLTPDLSLNGEGVKVGVSGLVKGVYFVRVGDKMYKFVKM